MSRHAGIDRPDHVVQGVPEDARRFLGRDHAPPPNTLVLAAKIEPVELALTVFTGRVRTTVDHATQVYYSAFSLRSVSFLTVIGTLHRSQQDAFRLPNRVVRLWPRRELASLDWPPSGAKEWIDEPLGAAVPQPPAELLHDVLRFGP